MAPRVFLSSTVYDLADLRSAVQYYLEEQGFEVYASESSDFPHDLDHEARVAALTPLDDADVYLLIVGFRYGSTGSDGVSATRLEFRRARELHRENGRPRPIMLVRRDVLRLKRAAVESVDRSDDWIALQDFINEIADAGPEGDPNWINEFATFRDVASILGATLRLTAPLRRLALEANLIEELLDNAERLLLRVRDVVGPRSRLLADLDGKLTGRGRAIPLTATERNGLLTGRLLMPPSGAFATAALEDAVRSGEFLVWDRPSATWRVGDEQRALMDLRDRILRYDQLAEILAQPISMREYSAIGSGANAGVVSEDFLSVLLGVRDQLANVEVQVVQLLLHLMPTRLPLVEVPPLPASPIPGEAERIAAESVSRTDALDWVQSLAAAISADPM